MLINVVIICELASHFLAITITITVIYVSSECIKLNDSINMGFSFAVPYTMQLTLVHGTGAISYVLVEGADPTVLDLKEEIEIWLGVQKEFQQLYFHGVRLATRSRITGKLSNYSWLSNQC